MTLDFSVVLSYAEIVFRGLLWTILITVLAGTLSVIFGILIATTILYGSKVVSLPVRAVTFLFMGTPLLLQLYLLYYGLSQVGVMLPAFWTGVVGLGLHYASYNADIFRASLESIDSGQTEAARSLGFARGATLRYFVVPQAVLTALPQIGNNSIILLKDTAVLSVLGITELTLNAQRAISETYRPFEFYFTAALLYYLVNLAMEFILGLAARKAEAIR
ncbi:polar amino acid transport system permease protein [Agrobacterium tumefaciens]|uniref:Polar amino acid transport system permease protein n=1 Tax=Agrobacterium radiobacter TaxID=362 RepID=A0ABR6JCG7_AGRRD|nr:amino acid ABC transporter permease [Agrobacterium radiobacter]MBB4320450.1 polar amino acid transport system permease protein [Agrobacterium radiobacter]MBB4337115.1 polar amino acid transport system permease protein [Agrobacterium radiobacter]MBB4492637.1 polar amino acid transport system permease protein [Agrobacterium radiobacter]MBB4497535.1 polar amino acid transport system permease protein [Agrobacterium radiobacter]MBB4502554.1 polar amino acid transport system permease protein [Agr